MGIYQVYLPEKQYSTQKCGGNWSGDQLHGNTPPYWIDDYYDDDDMVCRFYPQLQKPFTQIKRLVFLSVN